jgi:hypothetical protein
MSSCINLSNPSAQKHDQWEATSCGSLSAHVKWGGLAQLFEFRPVDKHSVFRFVFIGFGLGVGTILPRIVSADIPNTVKATSVPTSLQCLTSFSAIDLNRSLGRLTTASATVALGYGITIITAFSLTKNFFEAQELPGFVAGGFGVGGSVNAGLWLQLP